MKPAISLFVFALCSSLTIAAQILPTSGCGCRVSATGIVSCSCPGAVPIKKSDGAASKQTPCDGRRELGVDRVTLSPGALLTRWVEGEEDLIVGKGAGELVNEAKSPPFSVSMSEGLIFLMPKEEP